MGHMAPMQHPFHLMPDMMVGPFRIQARLGAGGFGAVFRAECGGELYALKFAVHGPDSEDLNRTDARARRELACLLLITHPNVVRVWAHGRWPHPRNGYHYVVMDYVEGLTLTEWVKQTRPSLRQVLRLFDTLALTLDALHSQDIHHRDLKGSNILVRARDGEPVLVDFGAGELTWVAAPLTEGPLPPGTPHLRTPEALRFHREQYADPSARYLFQPTDDLYALGATLYEVLTSAPPFPPTLPREVLTTLIENEMPASPAVLNPQVPPALAELVLRLLAKRPEERPASGRALHQLFQTLLRDESPVLELSLSPGAHAATTEGTGGPAVTSSADNPERPLSGPADWGGAPPLPGSSVGEGSAPTEPAERASPGSPKKRARRQRVAVAATLALLAVLGGVLWRGAAPDSQLSSTSSSAPPVSTSEELLPSPSLEQPPPAAPPPPLANLFPDGGPMALTEPPPSSPLQTEKGPLMRTKPLAKNPTAPREPEKPLSSSSSVASALAAAAAVCVAGVAGSCTSSDPAVRPGPPARQECPPGAVETMRKEFGINARGYDRMLDVFAMPGYDVPIVKMNYQDTVPIMEGRHEVRFVSHRGPPKVGLPKKSVLVGDFFVRDRLYARFNEVRLPDGRRLPFCAELINPSPPFDAGVPFEPGSKPGAWKVQALVYVGSSDLTY
jgi:serine/threonine protein kinase